MPHPNVEGNASDFGELTVPPRRRVTIKADMKLVNTDV
jgi:hypothetical protein